MNHSKNKFLYRKTARYSYLSYFCCATMDYRPWSMDYKMIEIFTDGSSSGNPGPGGYGVILRSGQHYKELSEGFRKTTNNRMELMAVIKGLEAVKNPKQNVTIFSDSKYVIDAIEKRWVHGWVAKGFKDKKNKD